MRATVALVLTAFGGSALANDHNNLDAGRPLRFDDAYSIAFGERTFDFGLSMTSFRNRAPSYGFMAEFRYGFAKNQDIGIGFDSSASHVELSYFHGLRREIENSPALGYRVELGIPTKGGPVEAKLRGVMTRHLGQYDKVHLNLDAFYEDRMVRYGGVLGYSTPLGYPTRFDQTLLAEFAIEDRDGWRGTFGVGLRHQLDARSVLDVGVESEVFARAARMPLRVILGLSIGF